MRQQPSAQDSPDAASRHVARSPLTAAQIFNAYLTWFTTPLIIILFLLVWKAYVTISGVSAFVLPAPEKVLLAIVADLTDPVTYDHLLTTLLEIFQGFALAIVTGILLALLLYKVAVMERVLNPFIVAMQVVPKVALIPLFVVWFGFGMTSKVIVAAVLAFFPIFMNTLLGLKSIHFGHREVMETNNASRLQTFLKLEMPSALPYTLAGMEMGIVFATIGAVVGEFLGGNRGLGYLTISRLNSFQIEGLFSSIIILTMLGFVLYSVVVLAKTFAIPWHESVCSRRTGG
ncbi:ABC transporter permease [Microvirga antarctica]|uniref:ABC transporter permease n=1 Tax=Microvirga antarctica TaxID=2819233 RepID=UPI001B302E11|nr:ABC transporter permease [Microvirga antarctica]